MTDESQGGDSQSDESRSDGPRSDDSQSDDPLSAIREGFEYESTWEAGQMEPQVVADGVEVAATPEIIGFMEQTVYDGVVPQLPEGHRIVGVRIECDHRAPTPAGEEVTASITVEEVDAERGQLTSSATVEDDRGVAATGRMRHAVVERESFAEQVKRRFGGE